MNDAGTIRQEMVDELGRLIDLSERLRQAMLARDPDRILEVVAEGEALRLSPALAAAAAEVKEDEEVVAMARRLRRLQESNRLLASAFRRLYRQILRPANADDCAVYGRSGEVQGAVAGPLLIHQIG